MTDAYDELLRAKLALGRRGRCHELNPAYFADAVAYAQAMENQVNMPTLFDLFDELSEETPIDP